MPDVQNQSESTDTVVAPPATEASVDEVSAALKAFNETAPIPDGSEEAVADPSEPSDGINTEPTDQTAPKNQQKLGSEEELSHGWAALRSRQERFAKDREELKAEREAIAKERESFNQEKSQVEALKTEYNTRLQKAKKNPLEALQELGWTLEQAIKYVNDNGAIPQEVIENNLRKEFQDELKQIREEAKKEREQIENERKQRSEVEARQRNAEFARSFEQKTANEMDTIIKQETSKYKYLAKIPPQARLMNVLDRMIQAHQAKKPLALSDAMLQANAEARELAGWFGAVDAAESDPNPSRDVKSSNPGNQVEPLSNSDLNRSGLRLKKSPDDMTEEERIEAAINLYKS